MFFYLYHSVWNFIYYLLPTTASLANRSCEDPIPVLTKELSASTTENAESSEEFPATPIEQRSGPLYPL